jgi:phosphohistidine phosphatase
VSPVKRLSLVRHAKSSWKDAGLSDFERPLNARGERDAPRMGARLAAAGFRPDRLVSSPALRARETALHLAAEIGYPQGEIVFEPELYDASPDALLAVIRALPAGARHVALVAHNPGLTDLSNRLCDVHIDNIPTTGVVQMELAVEAWDRVEPRCGRLLDFDYPKRQAREEA